MTVDKIATRARVLVTFISVMGAAVFIVGVMLLVATFHHVQSDLNLDWSEGLRRGTPAIIIAAFGLLLSAAPLVIYQLIALLHRIGLDAGWRYEQILGTMENNRQSIEALRDTASLSEAAKAIAYRQKDREALRLAIREDIDKGDFEAASQLVDEMEERFGYRQEAVELREQVEEGAGIARERRIQDALQQIDDFAGRFEWTQAGRVGSRLQRLYPDHQEIMRINQRIDTAKDSHKRDLLKQWKDAVARDDVDKSVDLLRQLDQYLTPSEAEAYKESARDVFRKRLQQMGVQFALHVHDKSWNDAVRIGQQITDEFPNTRIAAEVREKMAILLEKASQPSAV